ncbi:MAG: hypothetical protein JJE07_07420 [Flavobacteriaceae bacterium]|nr:hypothetical protein [Flavobacteriaceae bacterium]
MKYIYFLLLVFSFQIVFTQEISLRKGAVTDNLSVNDSLSETFAIYLPSNYSNEKSWPVFFVFDPEGRGKSVVQLFRQPGEEQGYLIVASNNINSKDSLLNNLKVGTRLMSRVFNLFSVDRNRIYTAGLAEGAEVASAIPAVYNNIQGVLAVGDIWLNADLLKKDENFSIVGLVGTRDFRLYKMKENIQFLSKTGNKASWYKFDGTHQWPDSNLISHALGNFSLQALSKGLIPQDPSLVESLYRKEIETAEVLRRSLQLFKSYELLDKMKDKYVLFDKKDDLKDRQKNLRHEKFFKEQRREYSRAAIKETELKEQYIYFFNEDVLTSNFENLGWWSQQIKELQAFQQGKNQAEAEMAYRLEGLLQFLAKTTFQKLNEAKAHIDRLIFTAILQTIFDRENPEGYRSIISLSAGDGDYETALLYLEDLLKTGYKEMDPLYNIPGTLDLKLSPEYNALIKKYLGESRFYNNENNLLVDPFFFQQK